MQFFFEKKYSLKIIQNHNGNCILEQTQIFQKNLKIQFPEFQVFWKSVDWSEYRGFFSWGDFC